MRVLLAILALIIVSQASLSGLVNYYNSIFGGGYIPVTALLGPDQVVPALNNTYGGTAACLLNINANPQLLSCQIAHNVPTDVVSITLNFGGLGLNGASFLTFSGQLIGAANTDFVLSASSYNTKQFLNSLLNGQVSINVNTLAYPNGIIRGQMSESSPYFTAMSADQVLDDDDGSAASISNSGALGVGLFNYVASTKALSYIIYHNVANYYRGGIWLGTYGNEDQRITLFVSTASPISQTTVLNSDQAYVLPTNGLNVLIPSTANPQGDIRGQITGSTSYTYTQVAFLDSTSLKTNSTATGLGLFAYNCATRVLNYYLVQNVLGVKSIGLYAGTTRLISLPNPNSPSVGTRVLTSDQANTLFNSGFSLRVESNTFTQGEISGAITNNTANYATILNGRQVVPPVTSSNSGAFTLQYVGNRVVNYAAIINLSFGRDAITAIEFHNAPPGNNNSTVLWQFSNPKSSALLTDGLRVLNNDQLNALFSGNLYVLVRTLNYPQGELRGQVTRLYGNQCTENAVPSNCQGSQS